MRARLAALLLVLGLGSAAAQPAGMLAGYHESWAEPRVAAPEATRLARLPGWLDLVFLAFARPDARYRGDFDLRGTGLGFPFDGRFAREAVRALRWRHPGVKLLLSVGGATYADWSALEAGALARLVVDLELDGLDVDFEPRFPGCRADAVGQVACASDAPFIAAVRALRPEAPLPNPQNVRQTLQREEMGRAFLDWLNRPAERFRQPEGDTLVCRCEEVTAKQVRDTADLGCEGPNQMKAFLRCGMGPCQGRLCGLTVTELIAAQRKSTPGEVGYYRLRPPVKPITLAELASLPISDAERKAVER